MFSVKLIELAIPTLFIVFVLTQVILPLARSRPLFPWFRHKNKELLDDLNEANENLDHTLQESKISKVRRETEKISSKGKKKETEAPPKEE